MKKEVSNQWKSIDDLEADGSIESFRRLDPVGQSQGTTTMMAPDMRFFSASQRSLRLENLSPSCKVRSPCPSHHEMMICSNEVE